MENGNANRDYEERQRSNGDGIPRRKKTKQVRVKKRRFYTL